MRGRGVWGKGKWEGVDGGGRGAERNTTHSFALSRLDLLLLDFLLFLLLFRLPFVIRLHFKWLWFRLWLPIRQNLPRLDLGLRLSFIVLGPCGSSSALAVQVERRLGRVYELGRSVADNTGQGQQGVAVDAEGSRRLARQSILVTATNKSGIPHAPSS